MNLEMGLAESDDYRSRFRLNFLMLAITRGSDAALMSCRFLGVGEAVTGSSVVGRCGSNARAPRCCIVAFIGSCASDVVLSAVERWYDFPEFGGCLEDARL